MVHPHEAAVAKAYAALNRRDLDAFVSAFADDAVWHTSDDEIVGVEAIRAGVEELIESSENSLQILVHDIIANDDHTVVLQLTTARLGDRLLEDRVVYVYHMNDDGLIQDAYFVGDPRIQDEFYRLA